MKLPFNPFSRNSKPIEPPSRELLTHNAFKAQVAPAIGAALAPFGFEQPNPAKLRWVDGHHPPIRPIFELNEWQGGSYLARVGVGLDFVPHRQGSKTIWRRTPKSARPCLWLDIDTPREVRAKDARQGLLDPDPRELSRLYGEQRAGARVTQFLAEVLPLAEQIWASAQRIEDLPELAQTLLTRTKSHGFGPPAGRFTSALAFIWAQLGERDSALEAMAAFDASPRGAEDAALRASFRARLHEALRGT
jgi:hypothetical protein